MLSAGKKGKKKRKKKKRNEKEGGEKKKKRVRSCTDDILTFFGKGNLGSLSASLTLQGRDHWLSLETLNPSLSR
jgi:hypothetical protein